MVAVHPPPRLFGRIGELEVLGQLLEEVQSGRSAVLVLHGEPGIGKTALLRTLIGAAAGFRVVRGAGVESEMELPFAGLHQLCASMLSRLGSLAEPQRHALGVAFGLESGETPDRFLVALAALSLMAEVAEEMPLLCVVDDVQWLDQASAQVLGFVGRRLLAEPIALVFALRTPAAPPDPFAGLPDLQLSGLDDQAAGAFLETLMSGPLDESVRRRIIEETHGNPLALVELCGGLAPAGLAGGFALPDAGHTSGLGDLSRRIEDQYIARLRTLPADAQRLLILAAADPVGESTLILRAASSLGLDPGAMNLTADAGLLSIGAHVRFRHPLVRSAAYRAAGVDDRRAAHAALAAATDPHTDPDRRAWHRAHATSGPDQAVAAELVGSASRAQRRGGVAAAAAFLERAVALTPDPDERASRALTAAEAKYAAGDFVAAQALLAAAEAGPLGELGNAHVQRMRAQIAFALRRGSDAPPLLLRAAQRLEGLDAELARQTYLEALVAAVYAGRLARDGDTREVARAAGSAYAGPGPLPPSGLLLRGLAVRLTNGYVAAAPILKNALRLYRSQPQGLDWLSVSYNMVAMDLWDDAAWLELASGQVQRARANGTLSWLPFALDYFAEIQIQAGELSQASALLAESERIDPGIREATLPYVTLLLAAWRGDAAAATGLTEAMVRGAELRGEGAALTYAEYATAVLNNGLGNYELAAEAAQAARAADELVISPWALAELAEASARSDQREHAARAASQLSGIAAASGSEWALGMAARSSALLAEGSAAEDLHREAVELLCKTRMASHLARAQLCYGEWLRRENRRIDAREQLRPAYEAFTSMGAHAFAERARRELLATGEKVRKRSEDTGDDLTPQEEEIAHLARGGLTNAEIGAQLFIGARTVEWHLRKVFAKLDISSRRELDDALRRRKRAVSPV